jgi:hypothetical protein
MTDLSQFTDLEIFAGTLLGESESLGERGMEGTALTIINRAALDLHWMGGNTVRGVCLQKGQYDVWDGGADTNRVSQIMTQNVLYGPYVEAMQIADDGLAGRLQDWTNGAVSYVDPPAVAITHPGAEPCLVDGERKYYDLKAVA